MAVGSTSSLPSGNGITINIGGGAEAANATGGATSGLDATIQADIQKLVEDLQKLSQSNATSESGKSGKSGKSEKSAKENAPGQQKKAEKSNEQTSKLLEIFGKILQALAKMLGGGQSSGSPSSGSSGILPGEENPSAPAKGDTGGTVINVNTK